MCICRHVLAFLSYLFPDEEEGGVRQLSAGRGRCCEQCEDEEFTNQQNHKQSVHKKERKKRQRGSEDQ